jgi:hypothetical protein
VPNLFHIYLGTSVRLVCVFLLILFNVFLDVSAVPRTSWIKVMDHSLSTENTLKLTLYIRGHQSLGGGGGWG